jgi:hypothetical protein
MVTFDLVRNQSGKQVFCCEHIYAATHFMPRKEFVMFALISAFVESATRSRNHGSAIRALAERRLRTSRYLALRNISCNYLDGVLVLRGCLPTYYLKQVAQVAVSHLEGVVRIDNQILVMSVQDQEDGPQSSFALRPVLVISGN